MEPKAKNFFTQLYTRLTMSSPSFFKKMQRILMWLTGIFVSLVTLKNELNLKLPDIVEGYFNYGSVFAFVLMYLIAKAPVENMEDLQKKLERMAKDSAGKINEKKHNQ